MKAPKLAAGQGPPTLSVLYIIASLAFAVGAILLGLATMRAGMLPRLAGVLLIVGGVVSALGAAPLPSVMSSILGSIGSAVFFLGVVWIGYGLGSAKGQLLHQPELIS